jgi:hypothetical protein
MGASCAAVFPQGDFLPRTAKASPGPARCAHEPSLPPSTGTANNPPPWVAPHRRNPSRICIRSSNTQPQSQPPRQIDQPRSRSRNRQPQPPWHAARRNGRTPPAPPVEVQYGLSEPGHWLDKQPDDRGSSNAAHADREDKKPPWKRAPPVWRDACGNGVAQAALSYTTSHSPVQDNGTALPDDRWFVVSGRGSTEADAKPMRLPEVDSPMKLRCPHACFLILEVSHREEHTIHIDVRYGKTEPCKFVLQAHEPADRSCPGCDRHIRIELVNYVAFAGSLLCPTMLACFSYLLTSIYAYLRPSTPIYAY